MQYITGGGCLGPYHASLNPSGTGNTVSNGVTFIPFLTTPQYTNVPPIGDIELEIYGPQRVTPGRTAQYAIWYRNLTQETLHDAVVVLVLPFTADLLDASGNAIFWPQRHQVYWKLGDLAPGAGRGVSARVRYAWGTPIRTLDAAMAFMLGQEKISVAAGAGRLPEL